MVLNAAKQPVAMRIPGGTFLAGRNYTVTYTLVPRQGQSLSASVTLRMASQLNNLNASVTIVPPSGFELSTLFTISVQFTESQKSLLDPLWQLCCFYNDPSTGMKVCEVDHFYVVPVLFFLTL